MRTAGQVEMHRLYSVNSQVANNLILCPNTLFLFNNIIYIFNWLGFPLFRLKAIKHKIAMRLITSLKTRIYLRSSNFHRHAWQFYSN